jgi:hypothetical protein
VPFSGMPVAARLISTMKLVVMAAKIDVVKNILNQFNCG